MSSLLSCPAGMVTAVLVRDSRFWNNLSSAFLSLSNLISLCEAVSALMRTSTPVELMKASEYSARKENFLLSVSRSIPSPPALWVAGSWQDRKPALVRTDSSATDALAAEEKLVMAGWSRAVGCPALKI